MECKIDFSTTEIQPIARKGSPRNLRLSDSEKNYPGNAMRCIASHDSRLSNGEQKEQCWLQCRSCEMKLRRSLSITKVWHRSPTRQYSPHNAPSAGLRSLVQYGHCLKRQVDQHPIRSILYKRRWPDSAQPHGCRKSFVKLNCHKTGFVRVKAFSHVPIYAQ